MATPTPPEARSDRRQILRGHMALLAVQVCFGFFPIFGKLAFEGLSPGAVAAWRFLVAGLVLGALAWTRHGRDMIPRPADLIRLQVCSLLGVAINMVVFLEGLERTTAVNAGLLMPVIPVYTFAIAVAMGQERFSWRRGAGILMALSGTLFLLFQKGPELSSEHMLGNLLIVINTLSYSLYLVISKPLLVRYPPLVVIAWVFLLSIWTIPLFAEGETLLPSGAGASTWLSLGYILVFPTLIAYLLNTFALSLVTASTTATYILFQPLIAVLAGVLVLGEAFLPGTGVAAAVILAGVWLVVRGPR